MQVRENFVHLLEPEILAVLEAVLEDTRLLLMDGPCELNSVPDEI
jgi:hypothetical protein